MRLSVVTINYNGSEKTIKLLKSLAKQTDKDFKTIVIDNASDEADFNALSSTMGTITNVMVPMVMVIRNDKNLGFSGGNNVGVKKALENGALRETSGQAEWILLLNNDTWVEASFIVSLRAKLTALEGFQGESRPNGRSQSEGVVGIPLNEGDHTAYWGNIEWLKPTLRHIYAEENSKSEILNTKQGSKIQNSKFKILNSRAYAIGGAVAIHRDVFEKIGLMDEKYFLYFEDADFSIMAVRAGFKLTFLEDPKVYHQASSTTKKLGASLLLRYHYRNALYFNLKNGPWYIKILVRPWSGLVIIKQVLKIMIYHNRDQSLAILRGVFDWYFNKMGKIK